MFGERSAGEEVQDGTDRSLFSLLLPCPAPLCHSLVAATCWILVLLCPRSEARGHEWAAAGVLVRGVLLRSTQESVVASDGMR